MKIVIDKDAEIKKLEDMLETLTDDKDRQSVRFAINLIEGFSGKIVGHITPDIYKEITKKEGETNEQ